jgi:hypothetical protein
MHFDTMLYVETLAYQGKTSGHCLHAAVEIFRASETIFLRKAEFSSPDLAAFG